MTVRVTDLGNGMRVATDPMPAAETVSLGAWIETGARDETAANNGISHLLEHMVFKGTERRSARDIAEEIEAVGGHLNAYTSRENTAYYAKILKGDVDLAVDVISDIVLHATMDPVELEREKSVICQEIHQANDTPDDIIFDHLQEAAYPAQPIGRPVLGTEEIIRGLGRDDIFGYMGVGYTAPAVVFCAAGAVDHDRLVDGVGKAFGGLPTGPRRPRENALYTGGEMRVQRDLEQAHILIGFDSVGYKDKDFYAVSVLSALFGGGMSSRLFQEIREERGLAYSIYSFLSCYEEAGMFGIYAGTGEDELDELIPLIAAEAEKVVSEIRPGETERARAQLKANILMARESTSARAEQLARQIMVFNRALTVDEIVAEIDAIDDAAVKAAAAKMFSGRPTLAAIGPIQGLESQDRFERRFNGRHAA